MLPRLALPARRIAGLGATWDFHHGLLGSCHPKLTIGNDAGTAQALETMGCSHEDCPVTEFVVDQEHRIVTTPAYMLGPSIAHVQLGIQKTVDAVLGMI